MSAQTFTGFFVALQKPNDPRQGVDLATQDGRHRRDELQVSSNSVPEKSRIFNNQNAARRMVASAGTKSAVVVGIDDELIKCLPEIGRAAYVKGLGSAFLIWTLLRAVDRQGTRYLDRETALRYLSRNGITRRKIVHAVQAQKAHGITFFEIYPTRIEYTGQKRIAAQLGTTRAARPQMIRRGTAKSIGLFFSAVYAAWLASIGDKYGGAMLSRARITELWSIGETQQRKWEHRQGVIVQANVGRFDTPAQDDESADAKRLLGTLPRDKDDTAHSWERDGKTFFQSVNRYIVPFAMSCPMGATRKATAHAKHVNGTADAVQMVGTARSKYRRVFYSRDWLTAKPWQMSATGSSMIEAGESITTRRNRRDHGTGLLMRYSTNYAVYDACSMRPLRRGALL